MTAVPEFLDHRVDTLGRTAAPEVSELILESRRLVSPI
jgi:hypothetical protein